VHVVRDLARQVVEVAADEKYQARRRRWRDVQARRRPDRAPVWCRPDLVWDDLIAPDSLACSDPLCREMELAFRQELYKDWVGDDHIIAARWNVPAVWDCDSEHPWGLRTDRLLGRTDRRSVAYEHPVQTEQDYERMTVPTFSYNHAKTQAALCRAAEVLGDAMPVRMTCSPPLGARHEYYLVELRAMQDLLGDLALRPELVHRAMAKITEGVLASLRVAEETNLLTPNHDDASFWSEPVNGSPPAGQVRLHHLWTLSTSQEFQGVSPRMQAEFLMNYQLPALQQFGAVQYGCCEDLTRKIEIVLRIPNLRVFVCSAWTDLERVIEACGTRYTIQWRQHAGDVVFPNDLAPIREHLQQGMRKLQGHCYQVVLRELETLHGHPNRLQEWARTAIDLAEKYA
jgi:hypothetical protein